MTEYTECVACSGELEETENPGIAICSVCQGFHGDVPEALKYVDVDAWAPDGVPTDRTRYFDITLRDQKYRVHGWFDPVTRKVVQFG